MRCQAYVKTNKKQCQRNALKGSKYCWSHETKGPLFASLILGGLISLFLSSAWNSLVVSDEERELINLHSENVKLNESVNTLAGSSDSLLTQNTDLFLQNQELLRQIAGYQNDIEEQKRTVEALRDYSDIAHLDALGYPPGFGPGSDLKVNSQLVEMLKETYTIRKKQLFMRRDSQAEVTYRAVIGKYPNFPFGYYFVSLCLRERKDVAWRKYARQAAELLQKTTMIAGHNENHDEILTKLQGYLSQK